MMYDFRRNLFPAAERLRLTKNFWPLTQVTHIESHQYFDLPYDTLKADVFVLLQWSLQGRQDLVFRSAQPQVAALLGLTPAGQGCRHALHLGSLFGQKTTRPGGVHFSACLPAHFSDYNVIEPYFLANVRKNYFDIS